MTSENGAIGRDEPTDAAMRVAKTIAEYNHGIVTVGMVAKDLRAYVREEIAKHVAEHHRESVPRARGGACIPSGLTPDTPVKIGDSLPPAPEACTTCYGNDYQGTDHKFRTCPRCGRQPSVDDVPHAIPAPEACPECGNATCTTGPKEPHCTNTWHKHGGTHETVQETVTETRCGKTGWIHTIRGNTLLDKQACGDCIDCKPVPETLLGVAARLGGSIDDAKIVLGWLTILRRERDEARAEADKANLTLTEIVGALGINPIADNAVIVEAVERLRAEVERWRSWEPDYEAAQRRLEDVIDSGKGPGLYYAQLIVDAALKGRPR